MLEMPPSDPQIRIISTFNTVVQQSKLRRLGKFRQCLAHTQRSIIAFIEL